MVFPQPVYKHADFFDAPIPRRTLAPNFMDVRVSIRAELDRESVDRIYRNGVASIAILNVN